MSSARRFSQHAQDPEKQVFSGGQSQFSGAYKGSSDFFSGASHTSPVQEEFQGEAMPRGIITRRSTLSSRLRNKPGVSTDKTNTSVSVNSVTSLLDLLPREQEPEKPGLPGGRLQFGSSGLFSRKADSPFSEAGIPLRLRNKPGASTDKTNTSVSVNIVRPAIRLSPRAQVPEKQVFSGGQLQFANIQQGSPDLFSRATNYPSSEAGKLSGTVLRTSTPSQQYISPMMENSRPAKVTKDVHTSPQWTARTQRDKSMVNSRPAAAVGNSMYKQSQWTTRSPRGKRIVTISPTEAMPAPVCLIDNDANGSMRVRREALEILDQITQPVVVVAIVGLYRTGKSFLMNKLAGKHNGFALGATIESETKGIWMWCVPHPTKVGHTLVLLDTEGLGDVEKGDEKHDTWIFCLAVLLSSTLVYNSMGTIDNHALEKLHYVTELTEHIKVKSGTREGDDQSTEFMSYFPSFVWTVRDFTLKLELKGQPVTADQYLDNALKLKTGSSKNIEMYNLPRRCLREFFSPRKCFVFDRPASVEKMWQMEQLTDADLKPSFLKEAEDFRNYIFNNGQAKTMREGLGLTGRMLGTLAETYVKAISSGQVPCLDNAVESLSQIQNKRAVTEALDFYESEMSRNVQLPTETQEDLSEIHTDIQREAVEIFINNSFNDIEQKHQIELMRSLQSVYEEYCRENVETSRKKSKSVISHVFSSLETQLQRGSYMRPGGYAEFRYALDKATRLYRSKKGHGLKSEEVLKEYLSEKEKIGFNILAADKSLTEAQQEIERERWESEAREQQQRFLEEQNRIKDQQIMDQQRAYDENISQLLMKMEREQQNAKQEYERLLNARLKEQKDLLEQGFGYRAEQMQREIDSLREKKKSSQSSFVDTAREAAGTALEVAGTAAMMMLPGPAKLLGVGLFAASKFFSSRK